MSGTWASYKTTNPENDWAKYDKLEQQYGSFFDQYDHTARTREDVEAGVERAYGGKIPDRFMKWNVEHLERSRGLKIVPTRELASLEAQAKARGWLVYVTSRKKARIASPAQVALWQKMRKKVSK